ncbi:MAG: RNA polymerase sigma-70 factor [Bacteroidota bacterium]|nr:RNA polymerase sigma-70 factor [Bacteroidota bacterium]
MSRYNELSDEELIGLLRKDDHAAFTEIYNRYWNKLMAIAYNHTKDKSSAKEIVQELFVGLWNRKNALSIKSLNGYLATAVKFSVYKQIERERKHREIAQREYPQKAFTNDDHIVELKFLQEYINGQVELLPEKCRLVFNYSRVKGLSNAEIAKEMNISEKTVEGHLTKGLKKIQVNLKNSGIAVILGTCALEAVHTLF